MAAGANRQGKLQERGNLQAKREGGAIGRCGAAFQPVRFQPGDMAIYEGIVRALKMQRGAIRRIGRACLGILTRAFHVSP